MAYVSKYYICNEKKMSDEYTTINYPKQSFNLEGLFFPYPIYSSFKALKFLYSPSVCPEIVMSTMFQIPDRNSIKNSQFKESKQQYKEMYEIMYQIIFSISFTFLANYI